MKIKEWEYFIGIFFIAILNGINQANNNFKYFVFFQMILVLCLSLKNIKKSFLLHIIFMLISNNFILTLDSVPIVNYSKLKVIGNLSYSYFILLFFFFIALCTGKNNRIKNLKNKELKHFYFLINFFCLYPLIFSFLGFTFNEYYNMSRFIICFIYVINLLIYFFIIISLYSKEDYKLLYNILLILIFVSCIYPFTLKTLNEQGSYGGIKIWLYLDIVLFANILFFIKGFFSKFFLLIYIFSFKFIASGRNILFLIITFYKVLIKLFKKNNLYIIYILLLLTFFIFFINKEKVLLFIAKDKNSLFYYKIRQIFSLLEFWNLEKMPNSPKIRVIEAINIILTYLKKPWYLIFGFGFGGYYQDFSNLFQEVSLKNGAFSDEIIKSGFFPNAHIQLLNIFLFNGLLGLIIIGKYCIFFWKNIERYPLALVSFFWFFYMFYFNQHIMIFCLLATYLFFIKYTEE